MSAVYYYPLIFGKGAHLEVEPKSQPPTKPSVFLMKNGTKVACLVKDFYPKNIIINIESSKKITEFDPIVIITPNGKYSTVKLGQYEDPDSVMCSVQHNSELVQSIDFEFKSTSSVTVEPTELEDEHQALETSYEPTGWCQWWGPHSWKGINLSLKPPTKFLLNCSASQEGEYGVSHAVGAKSVASVFSSLPSYFSFEDD